MGHPQVGPKTGAAPLRLRALDRVDGVGSLPDEEVAIAAQADRRVGQDRFGRRTGLQQFGELVDGRLPLVDRPAQDRRVDFQKGVFDDLASFSHCLKRNKPPTIFPLPLWARAGWGLGVDA